MRTTRDPASLIPTIRTAIRTAAPDLVVPDLQTYDERFDRIVAQRKFNMIVLALFGLLAIAIAAAGIYGVMAYLVEQRTQEIGVRMALGAEPARVARMVLMRATAYMTLGLAIGPRRRLAALEIRAGVSLQAGRPRSDRLSVGRRAARGHAASSRRSFRLAARPGSIR